ncbi:MAG: hypothetical protein IJ819_07265 [Clostridiales bacterium]|nr:hypothetical protein [Clostridiales bacterium]
MSKHISDIKQVSRLDDLRPATEKPINKASNLIKNGSEQASAIDTAERSGVSAIRQARMLSESSDRQEDQEAIDKLEASAQTASGDAATAAKESLKRQIKKKRPDIKTSNRTIQKADRIRKNSVEASQAAAKSATEAAKQSAIASQKVLSSRKTEQVAKKSAEWVKRIPQ